MRTKKTKKELSLGEKKVYALLIKGNTPKQVADILKISRSRARNVCSNIYLKKDVNNQAHLLSEELRMVKKECRNLKK